MMPEQIAFLVTTKSMTDHRAIMNWYTPDAPETIAFLKQEKETFDKAKDCHAETGSGSVYAYDRVTDSGFAIAHNEKHYAAFIEDSSDGPLHTLVEENIRRAVQWTILETGDTWTEFQAERLILITTCIMANFRAISEWNPEEGEEPPPMLLINNLMIHRCLTYIMTDYLFIGIQVRHHGKNEDGTISPSVFDFFPVPKPTQLQ